MNTCTALPGIILVRTSREIILRMEFGCYSVQNGQHRRTDSVFVPTLLGGFNIGVRQVKRFRTGPHINKGVEPAQIAPLAIRYYSQSRNIMSRPPTVEAKPIISNSPMMCVLHAPMNCSWIDQQN